MSQYGNPFRFFRYRNERDKTFIRSTTERTPKPKPEQRLATSPRSIRRLLRSGRQVILPKNAITEASKSEADQLLKKLGIKREL